ncbi:hypothetical protein JTB14_015554 [Gonioctena quinquepunctata]|nr:hypothetical protein JTB14_015554 [Gonioctena quinquepunctata]
MMNEEVSRMLITLRSTPFHSSNRLWAQNASVPKLKGCKNYDDWTYAVENYLILDGLKGCIDGTVADAVRSQPGEGRMFTLKGPQRRRSYGKNSKDYLMMQASRKKFDYYNRLFL